MKDKVFSKGYVPKDDPTYIQEWPIPNNLEDYWKVDLDPEIDYRGKRYSAASNTFEDKELSAEQLKEIGVEIQGHMISLSESNQNGLSAISTMIDKALALNAVPFPLYPIMESKDGKARLIATDQASFDEIFLTFGLARQQFFT